MGRVGFLAVAPSKRETTEGRFLRIRYGAQLDAARHYSILCNRLSALWFVWLMSSTASCVQAANAATVQNTEMFGEIWKEEETSYEARCAVDYCGGSVRGDSGLGHITR
jgi:hypothetical protein